MKKPSRNTNPKPRYRPDFHTYEHLKQAWLEKNPKATPEQYQKAMRQIAWMCRI